MAGCCTLLVEFNKDEYDRMVKCGHKEAMITKTDIYLKKHPEKQKHRKQLDKIHNDIFAEMKQGENKHCVLLDIDSRLCTIYEDRPKLCKDHTTDRCGGLRKCLTK
jgi:Fe-S-cluster containining protein